MKKTYIGTKVVGAEPMSKNTFAQRDGTSIKPDAVDAEGYMVEYADGYRSWSPKEVFENNYREVSEDETRLIKEAPIKGSFNEEELKSFEEANGGSVETLDIEKLP